MQRTSPSLGIIFRSYLIYVLMVPAAIFSNLMALMALIVGPLLSRKYRHRAVVGSFSYIIVKATRWICGVDYEVIGTENLPKDTENGHVIMANHQSTWETLFLQLLFNPNTVILKRELSYIPFFGWALILIKPIFIDRTDRRGSMRQVLSKGVERLKLGEDILIFPEGTRTKIEEHKAFSKGGAVLAARAEADIIPVAHNAGVCWPARSWLKYPGKVTVSVGPAISVKNRKYNEVLNEAERWIRKETKRLVELEQAAQDKGLSKEDLNYNASSDQEVMG